MMDGSKGSYAFILRRMIKTNADSWRWNAARSQLLISNLLPPTPQKILPLLLKDKSQEATCQENILF